MNKAQTLEAIKVMQAWCDGEEVEFIYDLRDDWVAVNIDDGAISWAWDAFKYRIAPQMPSINWDHVSDEYNWLAVDQEGPYLYTTRPDQTTQGWIPCGYYADASTHTSFKPGNVPWEESLVMRPGYEGK